MEELNCLTILITLKKIFDRECYLETKYLKER